VAVVSDHGEEFFEHGGIGHRRTVFREMLEIPMLFRLPGVLPAGRAVGGLVSLADVAPTVLELLGVPAPAQLGGRSMMPLVRGDDGSSRNVFGRLVRFYELKVNVAPTKAVTVRLATVREAFRTGAIKVIRSRSWPLMPRGLSSSERSLLRLSAHSEFRNEDLAWIDLARHPDEPHEAFSSDFSDPRARAALDAFRVRYTDLRQHAETVTPRAVDPQLRSALEGLGYVEPEGVLPMTPRRGFVLPPPGTPARH
jgi:arylsulfatase A-like enzyme